MFDKPIPDPFQSGWYDTSTRIYQELQEYLAEHPTYLDRPIIIEPYGYWTGGIFTLAVALRGHELMTDLYEDPQYVHDLLKYLNDATIYRVKAYHEFFNLPFPGPDLFFADDAIQMISTKMLKQFLIPLYKQYKEAVITSEHFKMHLCGDASRHFRILKDELGVNEFETGFPIDFKKNPGRIRTGRNHSWRTQHNDIKARFSGRGSPGNTTNFILRCFRRWKIRSQRG